jgi:hypothetical protein
MPIQDKFTSENPYILTVKAQTAGENQAALNAALDDTLGLNATAIVFQTQGINSTTGSTAPPDVTASAETTIGTAQTRSGSRFHVDPDEV